MIWRAIPLLLLASTASGQDEIPATPQNPQAAGGAAIIHAISPGLRWA